MLYLPHEIIAVLQPFAPGFSARIWEWANVVLVGAIFPGQRTVTAAVRVMGLSSEAQFQHDHRVVNRATWSRRAHRRIRLDLLLWACVPAAAPIVVGIDETIERRRGATLAGDPLGAGTYRGDPVWSSTAQVVKTSGVRWISLQVLAPST